ncbi:MAG TPA: efflux RND transporter permease subunit [Thermoanaerobaculia bacterium]
MRRLIAWFADNGVAANLLMLTMVAAGLLVLPTIPLEVFPEFSADLITVRVPYPGAAPEEVEEGVVIRVEEAVQDLEGIGELRATAAENAGTVTIELAPGADAERLLADVKARVDAIDTFPEEAEQPVIQEVLVRRQVINVAVSGDTDERTLKRLGERVRDEIVALPGITQVELAGARPDEIAIEVSEEALRRYGLTFAEVADAVRRSSLDLPGGRITAESGEVLLRTEGQAYRAADFAALPLVALPGGTRLTVGDVATVVDGFAETDQAARFDGRPTVLVQVFRVGDQSALEVARQVHEYVEEARPRMPEGVRLTTWQDESRILSSRLDLLLRNGRMGFVLVFIVLALFMRLSLAAWVALGIPISFLGALAVMPVFDQTINLISLFAFIVVLGIVVDDAIVVGESIYSEFEAGRTGLAAAVSGAHTVARPVIFAILTTIAAFVPLLTVGGNTGKIMRVIPLVVVSTLVFSLVESLLVLPNHLSHLGRGGRRPSAVRRGWQRVRRGFQRGLGWSIEHLYRPSLAWALTWRWVSVALALALLLSIVGLVAGGWVKFVFFPDVEADNVVALVAMPPGTPADRTTRAVRQIEQAALDLARDLEAEAGAPVVRHVLATIGEQPFRSASMGPQQGGPAVAAGHLGEVNVELVPSEERGLSSTEVAARWRRRTGPVPGADELTFTSSLFTAGSPIHVQLAGGDLELLQRLAERLKAEVRTYPGVEDVTDTYRPGKREIELAVTPEAEAAGLSLAAVGRQVRQAFFGEEAQRLQRGREDVRVMVRLPEAGRRSLGDLEGLRFRAPDGVAVPFSTAVTARLGRGPAAIERVDRRRVLAVTADVDTEVGNANEILADVRTRVLPDLLAGHPGIDATFEGEQQEQRETLSGLLRGFLFALLAIYALLAIPFRSYAQPFIVMSAIPFGLVGAVLGHLVLGIDLTVLSMFGVVALTGVVVNDSLVMIDFINRKVRDEGMPVRQAIRESGVDRFRPILMTSLTTFAGLAPLLFERSLQAKFLIPMAASLAFGVLFATFITLVLVPCGYFILEDVKDGLARVAGRGRRAGTAFVPPR